MSPHHGFRAFSDGYSLSPGPPYSTLTFSLPPDKYFIDQQGEGSRLDRRQVEYEESGLARRAASASIASAGKSFCQRLAPALDGKALAGASVPRLLLRGGGETDIETDIRRKGECNAEAETTIAMEVTETLEASADATGVAAAGAGDVSAGSIEEINTVSSGMSTGENRMRHPGKSPVGAGGSSYMGSSAGAGSGGAGDGGSGGSGGSAVGLTGSSSTVKTYRHPTSSRQRNLIRERFMTALEPAEKAGEDKYTALTAAIAIEHSMYRYFGKVGER